MYRRRNREFERICKLASERVAAVIRCIDVLCPGLDPRRKKRLANKILTLCDGRDRSVKVTQAQAQELIAPHQHVNPERHPALYSARRGVTCHSPIPVPQAPSFRRWPLTALG